MFLAEVSIANKVMAQKVNGEEATLVRTGTARMSFNHWYNLIPIQTAALEKC